MGGVIFLNSNSKLTEYLKWLLITYVFVGIVLLFSSKLILDLTLSSFIIIAVFVACTVGYGILRLNKKYIIVGGAVALVYVALGIILSPIVMPSAHRNLIGEVEEVDLYKDHIPRLEYEYIAGRSALVEKEALKQLDDHAQKEIKRINDLCEQFIDCRVYVIAAPMWSLSFPPQLKEYFDCVIQDKKTIKFENKNPKGTLNNVYRSMVYIQSSGGKVPLYLKPILNKGLNYIKYIAKYLGIKKFKSILVDNTGTTEKEREDAIDKATKEIDKVIKSLKY